MKTFKIMLLTALSSGFFNSFGQYAKDIIKTSEGDLSITFIGHASLMMEFKGLTIHIDPTMQEAGYAQMPDADLVLVTHHHGDHLDTAALKEICKEDCPVVMTQTCLDNLKAFTNAVVLKNWEIKMIKSLKIQAIPAYNIQQKRMNGQPFHPKGEGNAYIITFGDKRLLIGGDTENTPEIKALKNIDIAFLPMNLPYTMTPEMVADAAKAFKPSILYPYHFGETDTGKLLQLLKDQNDIEIRIRDLR
jgi:L-ascorbate metabolism protein UlaG (beta-lactamase superfamily)